MSGVKSTFRPLQIINEERSTHGLRYGDYTRYRKHCAHKTHRLRSSLKMTHGKGREFKKLPEIVPERAKDGHLQLLLFETERAWAHAQELSAPQDARRSTARYRRSHNYLSRLLTLARAPNLPVPLSYQSTAELVVYALVHTARFNLRRPSSSTAAYHGITHDTNSESENEESAPAYPLVQLSVAYALLEELEKTARTSKEVALARAFKDEIGPEIRWCVHEFNRGNDAEDEGDAELEKHVLAWKKREWDIDGIVGDVAPAYAERILPNFGALTRGLKEEAAVDGGPAGKKQILEEHMWDGEPIPVRNPELVDVLLKVQEAKKKLQVDASNEEAGVKTKGGKGKVARGRIAKYDGVLLSLSDAVDQARKLVEAQQVSGASSTAVPGAGNRDIQFMHGYLTYQHLSYRIERDLLLLSALSDEALPKRKQAAPQSTASILHLLSGVLQSLSQAMALPITDESPDLSTALSVRLSHAKAQRALHLARAYADGSHKKYAEAVALTQRGHLHIREARATASILPADSGTRPQLSFYPLDDATLDGLEQQLSAEEERHKIEWFGYNGGVIGGVSEEHQKPLFFDIAFNYVEPALEQLRARAGLPPQDDKSGAPAAKTKEAVEEEVAEEVVETSRGGLSGLLGSWWSRR
ncbi:hypothetical protein K439DRAFT_1654959 [Ramaria rubella]|nr:hypothetical protein K439DRAFT_1654959 [Ramaria rubella]